MICTFPWYNDREVFCMGEYVMTTREEAILYCKSFENVVEDYPFHDSNWTLMRHISNKKTFACIYEHQNSIWINVKCDPEWRDFWRSAFESIVPAYHMSKEHWNSIILDRTIPRTDIERMIAESYELTKPKAKKIKK
jgi:predicted DNA-binding protein (MmcQ/YjbR family)